MKKQYAAEFLWFGSGPALLSLIPSSINHLGDTKINNNIFLELLVCVIEANKASCCSPLTTPFWMRPPGCRTKKNWAKNKKISWLGQLDLKSVSFLSQIRKHQLCLEPAHNPNPLKCHVCVFNLNLKHWFSTSFIGIFYSSVSKYLLREAIL